MGRRVVRVLLETSLRTNSSPFFLRYPRDENISSSLLLLFFFFATFYGYVEWERDWGGWADTGLLLFYGSRKRRARNKWKRNLRLHYLFCSLLSLRKSHPPLIEIVGEKRLESSTNLVDIRIHHVHSIRKRQLRSVEAVKENTEKREQFTSSPSYRWHFQVHLPHFRTRGACINNVAGDSNLNLPTKRENSINRSFLLLPNSIIIVVLTTATPIIATNGKTCK